MDQPLVTFGYQNRRATDIQKQVEPYTLLSQQDAELADELLCLTQVAYFDKCLRKQTNLMQLNQPISAGPGGESGREKDKLGWRHIEILNKVQHTKQVIDYAYYIYLCNLAYTCYSSVCSSGVFLLLIFCDHVRDSSINGDNDMYLIYQITSSFSIIIPAYYQPYPGYFPIGFLCCAYCLCLFWPWGRFSFDHIFFRDLFRPAIQARLGQALLHFTANRKHIGNQTSSIKPPFVTQQILQITHSVLKHKN